MSGTAVVISGVPATILPGVLRRLNNEFPQGYVFRGEGARLRGSRTADYKVETVDAALLQATDAVFGSSRRSFSFCRNPQRACALQAGSGKKTCGRREDEACLLTQPSRLILAYQEAPNEFEVLDAFYYSALALRLSSTVYGRERATADLIAEQLRAARQHLARIEGQFATKGSPLLLPPRAFRSSGAVVDMLREVNAGANPPSAAAEFKRNYWKRDAHGYVSDHDLAFKAEERHGVAGAQNNRRFALSAIYRLGCTIESGFHWNVSPVDQKAFGQRWTIKCRQRGALRPTEDNINMFPDDRLR